MPDVTRLDFIFSTFFFFYEAAYYAFLSRLVSTKGLKDVLFEYDLLLLFLVIPDFWLVFAFFISSLHSSLSMEDSSSSIREYR